VCSYEQRKGLIEKDNPILSITIQCDIVWVSKSSLYHKKTYSSLDREVMSHIDWIYTQHPYYGTRRISVSLSHIWYNIGRKKVRSYMTIMWICALYPKKNTSRNNIQHQKYPYLLRDVRIDRINQVRSTDITYIKLKEWFVYLVCILDRYSRKIIARDLSTTMDVWFCVSVLEKSLEYGKPEIFNTDQGSQFTSYEFVKILSDANVRVSMDGKGRYADNIYIERLWRTIKYEHVYIHDYQTPHELFLWLKEYIYTYNTVRLHSALWYKTPDSLYYESIDANMCTI